jgi:hypothetical protein
VAFDPMHALLWTFRPQHMQIATYVRLVTNFTIESGKTPKSVSGRPAKLNRRAVIQDRLGSALPGGLLASATRG